MIPIGTEGPSNAETSPPRREETRMNPGESEADRVAKRFLSKPPEPGDVRDATSVYPWISAARVYWLNDWQARRVVVVAVPDGRPPVRLTGDRAAVADFMSRQFDGRFPDASRVGGIAQLLKDATVGPHSNLADREFLDSQRADLASWLKGRQKDARAFESFCTGIRETVNDNEWHLQFNAFNPAGGVDSVKASGTVAPLTIKDLTVEVVKSPGEFTNPLEG
jgi:hypothetical protein